MPNVDIGYGQWCPELDLEPGVTTVTFTDEGLNTVEVIVIDNTAPIRWTCDGSEPSEDAGYYIPRDGIDERKPPTPATPTIVKLWTSGTAKACIQRG